MKKLITIITALTLFAGSAFADEGMWLLPLIQKMNGKAMKELGCELTPKQIYDINNTSLKDAIVQFGGTILLDWSMTSMFAGRSQSQFQLQRSVCPLPARPLGPLAQIPYSEL